MQGLVAFTVLLQMHSCQLVLSSCHVGVATTSMQCGLVSADDVVLKRAKRDKLLATHPDKLGTETIGANLAVGRVTQVPDTTCCTHMAHWYSIACSAPALQAALTSLYMPDVPAPTLLRVNQVPGR